MNNKEMINSATMDYSSIFKALGDKTRLQIVEMLSSGEMCACKILERFNITQPTLSHHMKILCECGLVISRKDGKWSHYSLSCDVLKDFQGYILNLKCCTKGDCQCK